VPLAELLSTCVDAAQRGCDEIRRVHASLSTEGGAIADSAVDYKVAGDSRSALTAADLAAQCAVVEGLERAWPGLRIVGEEDLACSLDSDAAMGGVCASDLAWSIAAAEPAGLRRDLLSALLEESAPEAAPVDTCQTAARSLLEECELQGGKGGTSSRSEPLSDVTVFVDPLDGTREFVEGRVWNVQTLIGARRVTTNASCGTSIARHQRLAQFPTKASPFAARQSPAPSAYPLVAAAMTRRPPWSTRWSARARRAYSASLATPRAPSWHGSAQHRQTYEPRTRRRARRPAGPGARRRGALVWGEAAASRRPSFLST